ncbi:SAYSvFN domain-containing protein 1-like [Glandiceps talaboti]
MKSVEDQLAEYRARKARECGHTPHQSENGHASANKNVFEDNNGTVKHDVQVTPNKFTQYLQRYRFNGTVTNRTILKCILWVILLVLFVIIEFAAIFIIVTLFYVVFTNLRSGGTRQPGELSAYSVFNPNCERIDGTLTAEQLQREMMLGPGAMIG